MRRSGAILIQPRFIPLAGASVDMDFVNGFYYAGASVGLSNLLATSRSTSSYSRDALGNEILFSPNNPRETSYGLLIQDGGIQGSNLGFGANFTRWTQQFTNAYWSDFAG